MRRMRTAEDRVVDTVNTILMVLVVALTIFPFYLIVVKSFNEGLDSNLGGLLLYPRKFTLDNYVTFFSKGEWMDAFVVTILRTLIGSVLSVLFTCTVAYGLSSEPGLCWRRCRACKSAFIRAADLAQQSRKILDAPKCACGFPALFRVVIGTSKRRFIFDGLA